MDIPRFWAHANDEVQAPYGKRLNLLAWGWSNSTPADAQVMARERLSRLLARVRKGEPLPQAYAYGSRPIREEIIQEFKQGGTLAAIVTRNRYGSLVLNAARLLVIDVDVPAKPRASWWGRLFGRRRSDPGEAVLDTLRAALQGFAPVTFRVYQTAAGYRAIATDREFIPDTPETTDVLQGSRADPAFIQLCRIQKSFRARLTPKPWRCHVPLPPGRFPYQTSSEHQQFESWLRGYEAACHGYAVCRYLESVGSGGALESLEPLIRFHDAATRFQDDLPLA